MKNPARLLLVACILGLIATTGNSRIIASDLTVDNNTSYSFDIYMDDEYVYTISPHTTADVPNPSIYTVLEVDPLHTKFYEYTLVTNQGTQTASGTGTVSFTGLGTANSAILTIDD